MKSYDPKQILDLRIMLAKRLTGAQEIHLESVIEQRQHIPDLDRRGLAKALRSLAQRAEKFAVRLEAEPEPSLLEKSITSTD
jgi:hypothetical protein